MFINKINSLLFNVLFNIFSKTIDNKFYNFNNNKLKQSKINNENIRINYEYRIKSLDKCFYKIYAKNKLVYDIYGIRIIYNNTNNINDIQTAYLIQSIIKDNFFVIDKFEDDYIINPKSNNYQSLHMHIYYFLLIEIQIRNYNMHYNALNGSASNYF